MNVLRVLHIDKLLQTMLQQSVEQHGWVDQGESVDSFGPPRELAHGDLTSTVALKLAKVARRAPMDLAGVLATDLQAAVSQDAALQELVEDIQPVQPGFINVRLSQQALGLVLREIIDQGQAFGMSDRWQGQRVQVEFVSANPTGPLTVAHGRLAAIGDGVANLLGAMGCQVTREFYVNDEGRQIDLLGASTAARCKAQLDGEDVVIPEDGYHGMYLADTASAIIKQQGEDQVRAWLTASPLETSPFMEIARQRQLDNIKEDLERFHVQFDEWRLQSAIMDLVSPALDDLRSRDLLYEADGATWFRSTQFGDDKDRVVIKSDGTYTYLAPDIAYHRTKYERGFDRVIDIWGPDHHGYISRLTAAVEAFGVDRKRIQILIVQLVKLFRGGEQIPMSTRAGEFITLRQVIDDVGVDAARFFFLMRRRDSHLDFDLELAKSQSPDNPVYYIQYAHARIASLAKRYEEEGQSLHDALETADPGLLQSENERGLIRRLALYPRIVISAAEQLEPYVVLQFLQEVAGAFHGFYTDHRVVTDDALVTRARLLLTQATATVRRKGWQLLGVSAPDAM